MNGTIVNQVSSTNKRQHAAKYTDLDLILFLLVALQPLAIIKAELNGIEACQNRCFNKSECDGIGNGFCCRWDNSIRQCISSKGNDICPGTANMPSPPAPSTSPIACPPKATRMSFLVGHVLHTSSRTILEIEAEYSPSTSPTASLTKYDDRSCDNRKTRLERRLCNTFGYYSITQMVSMIITAKISSGLSILGSSYIVQDVLRDLEKRNKSSCHRIMLALSSSDITFSFVFFFGT